MKLDRELFERAARAIREGDEATLVEIASRNVEERARLAAARARQLGEQPADAPCKPRNAPGGSSAPDREGE